MKVIRQNVFETNSSSTHAICIAKDTELTIPKELHFESGEYGWEYDTLRTIQSKANYLFTGFLSRNRLRDFKKVVSILKKEKIKVSYEEIIKDKYGYDNGYIEHSEDLKEFLDNIVSDKDLLFKYLFSDLSFVLTGNDNGFGEDDRVIIKVDYEHTEFYKGN